MTPSNLTWPQWRDKPEWSGHGWMMDAMGDVRGGCYMELCFVAVTWCGDANVSKNDQRITDNNAEVQKINNNIITALGKRRNKETESKKDKTTSCFLSRPQRVVLLKWFRFGDWRGGWRVSEDLPLRTFVLCLLLMVPKHKAITQHNST